MLSQLRFGRGVDNRQLKAAGAASLHHARDRASFASTSGSPRSARVGRAYRYEREVEEFLRYSPSVRRSSDAPENLQA